MSDILPDDETYLDQRNGDTPEWEKARADIKDRVEKEKRVHIEVEASVRKLKELDKKNHYGESLRRAFGGK